MGDTMARTSATVLTIIAVFIGFAVVSAAAAGAPSARCPKTAEQYNDVLKVLANRADQTRALTEDNPLLLADLGFYQAELKSIRQCTPIVANAVSAVR